MSRLTRQLATLFNAGVPLTRSLEVCRTEEKLVQTTVDEMVVSLQQGRTLAEALRRQAFPEPYVQAVAVGERTGGLALVLERLALDLERQDTERRKIVAALTYPAMMLAMGGVLCLLFTFVLLPVMEQMFASMRLELPLLTRMVLALGGVARHPAMLVPILLLPLSLWLSRASIRAWLDESPLGLQLDGLWLRLPVVERRTASRLLYLLSLLIDSGCRLTEALDMLSRLSGNRVLARQFVQIRQQVFEGSSLTEAMRSCQVLRQDALQLIGAGEESARLGSLARMAARLNEMEADHLTEVMTALLEPLLMVAMGVISGILFVAVLLPTSMLISGLT